MLPLFKNVVVPDRVLSENVFDTRFWPTYPRQVGKLRAAKAFDRAITRTTIEQIEFTLAWQKRTTQWQKVDRFGVHIYVPHPATWLNHGRYNDPMPPSMAPKPQPAPLSPDRRLELLKLRAHIDHQNHLSTIASAEEFYRRRPWVARVEVACPCMDCRIARGEV